MTVGWIALSSEKPTRGSQRERETEGVSLWNFPPRFLSRRQEERRMQSYRLASPKASGNPQRKPHPSLPLDQGRKEPYGYLLCVSAQPHAYPSRVVPIGAVLTLANSPGPDSCSLAALMFFSGREDSYPHGSDAPTPWELSQLSSTS